MAGRPSDLWIYGAGSLPNIFDSEINFNQNIMLLLNQQGSG